jgi:hypothetical protein
MKGKRLGLCKFHVWEVRELIPLLVASSSSGTSTAAAGRCTYRTTEPRMKTFLTEL